MKKLLAMLVALTLLGAYAYYGIYLEEKNTEEEEVKKADFFQAEGLKEITFVTGDHKVELIKKDNLWWVQSPHSYLGDQDFIGKSLNIMNQAPLTQSFPFTEDRFGLTPGRAFFEFKYDSSENKRFVVGEEEGPQNTIYLLNKDSQQVHVVHNIWGQFLYFPPSMFLSKTLPIPGHQVKKIAYERGGKPVWSIKSLDVSNVSISLEGKTKTVKKAKLLWFFQKIRDFELKNLKFDTKINFSPSGNMVVETENGVIRFEFNEADGQVFIPEFEVLARYKGFVLKSVQTEIAKVMESDKK